MPNTISIVWILSFMLSIPLFGQIDLEDSPNSSTNFNSLIDQHFNAPTSQFEEDLLLASRRDIFIENEFVELDSMVLSYDADDQLTRTVTLRNDNLDWFEDLRDLSQYDTKGNRILFQRQFLIDGIWENSLQTIAAYDSENNEITRITQRWQNNVWVNDARFESTYNSQNQLIQQTRFSFDQNWTPFLNSIYVYNDEGFEILKTTDTWDGAEWLKSRKKESQYDQNNNLIEEDDKEWNDTDWVPGIKVNFEYNSENLEIKRTLFRNQNDEYQAWFILDESYNDDGDLIEYTSTRLKESGWELDNNALFSYDQRRNKVYELRQKFVDTDWQNFTQTFFYYNVRTINSTDDQFEDSNSLTISPNPSNGVFALEFEDTYIGPVSISVFSSTGQLVHHLNSFDAKGDLDLVHLSNGYYTLKITNKEKNWLQKISIQH